MYKNILGNSNIKIYNYAIFNVNILFYFCKTVINIKYIIKFYY